MKRRLALFYYGPLALWMLVIFVFSTGTGSPENSTSWIEMLLGRVAPRLLSTLTPYQMDCLNYALRKLGHLAEYTVLTLLAVRALQFGRPVLRWQSLVGALLLSGLYAATDEIHQWFVPNRSASPLDVMIDISGSVLCMAAILLWFGSKALERRLWASRRRDSTQAASAVPD